MRERYVVTNGIRVFCVEEGVGPLVLLLHGFPEFWWSWRHQLPALAGAGFRAVAVDLPGYGRSDKPDVAYDEEWINTTLAGLVPALGHTRAAVVGHDWGGLLVWPLTRRFPDRVAAVVGVNTPDLPRPAIPTVQLLRQIFDPPTYIVQFQDRGPAEWFLGSDPEAMLRGMFGPPVTRQTAVFTEEVVARFVEVFRPVGALTPPIEYYRNMDRNWELGASLAEKKIEAPALMISAEHDPVLTPAMANGMEERVPNVRKVVIPDCGHWTQQEQPEATNRHLIEFLSGLEPWA